MTTQRRSLESSAHVAGYRIDLDALAAPPPWVSDANCAGTDPEAFFPEKGGSTREAKRICARCTVQAECLDWSLENYQRFGIWGGMSERDRRSVAQALGKQTDPEPHLQESA